MNFRVLAEVDEELSDAAGWYDDRRTGLGDDFLDVIQRSFGSIQQSAESFPLFAEERHVPKLRHCPVPRFPYVIIFRTSADEILVVAVAHLRRRPFYWRERVR